MLFPSEIFILAFLPLVVVVYYALLRKSSALKNIWLLICSLVFYAWGEPLYVFLMIGVILLDYLAGYLLGYVYKNNGTIRRCILVVTIVVNVCILGWFKYAHFVFSEINRLFGSNIQIARDVVLPIGISFFTFQAMSYVFDIYQGRVHATRNPLKVGLYVSFFPQLIAGPIVRYSTIEEQIDKRTESLTVFSDGVVRFLKGLLKKVLIANNMAIVADAVWGLIVGDRLEASVALAWLGAISYMIQIYFDFSGYSDMAIGLGKRFGFEFMENFNHPYMAGSLTGFWKRWHISLTGWFRDYVYIPLGGSRVGRCRLVFNVFVVWLLTGIWHGANWTFLVWGMLHFAIMITEKMLIVRDEKRPWWGHLYTLIVVCIGWVIFRSDSLTDAFVYIKGMVGIGSGALCDKSVLAFIRQNAIYYILAIIGCFPTLTYLEERYKESKVWNVIFTGILCVSVIIAMSFIINNAYSPFIYFNF